MKSRRNFLAACVLLVLGGLLVWLYFGGDAAPPVSVASSSGQTPVVVPRLGRSESAPATLPPKAASIPEKPVAKSEPATPPPAAEIPALPTAPAAPIPTETGSIEGQVFLDDQPVSNVTITLRDNVSEQVLATAVTDAAGAFMFAAVRVGETGVFAEFEESLPTGGRARTRKVNAPAVVEANQVTPVLFELQASDAAVEGLVTVEGSPATAYGVSAWVFTASGSEHIVLHSEENGEYFRDGLPPGHAKIQARVYGRDRSQQRVLAKEVELIPGETAIVDFNFEGGSVLFGKVNNLFPGGNNGIAIYAGHLPESNPREMTPEAFYHLHETMLMNIYLDNLDTFRSDNVPAGDYTVSAYSIPGQAREAAAFREGRYDVQNITLVDGEDLELAFDLE